MEIEHFFDPSTWTLTYIVYDEETRDAVIIDPVLEFDPLAVATHTTLLDRIVARVEKLQLRVQLVLDTHAHADHLSGSLYLKEKLGTKIGIGAQITGVQDAFKGIFNLDELATDGSQWDVLIRDAEPVEAGSLTIEPMHSPGHTPACFVYKIRDAIFTGDVLFMPDFGTGRCDFPGGSAQALYKSIKRLYVLPDDTRVFVGHDYQPGGRALQFETTIGESRSSNKHLRAETTEEEFVEMRTKRDATLRPPRLIFQSLQVNADAGRLPEPESNGMRYMRLPMGVFPAHPG